MRIKYTMFMLAAILAACTNEPLSETIVEEAPESYTLVVTATKGNDDTTKALSLDGKTLNATWAVGETVSVYSVMGEGYDEMESSNPVGTLTAQGSGATTTLKGKFLEGYTPTVGAKLRLKFNDKPDYTTQEGTLEISCSKGTYVRTIIDDLGAALGTGAVMTALRRTFACGFSIDDCITLDDLKLLSEKGEAQTALRSVESLFYDCAEVKISDGQAKRFSNGGALDITRTALKKAEDIDGKIYRVKNTDSFLGLAKADTSAGLLKIYKLFPG